MELQRLTPEQFEKFRKFIYRESGIQVDERKITMLSNRIRRRVKASSHTDFENYFRFLNSKAGARELNSFLDVVTTHETSFFRTPKQFDWLREQFVSQLVDEHRSGRRSAEVKLWSAGCSNGAEAYSMAMCLLENTYRLRNWQLDIIGTDISQENIAIADRGVFKGRLLESIPTEKRRQWFRQEADDLWRVRPTLRSLVRFTFHNLMSLPSETDFDCIFIRNVLIYFDRQSKRRVIRNLVSALKPGGYLVVGPSEGVHDLLGSIERVSPLIYRNPLNLQQSTDLGQLRSRDRQSRSPNGDPLT